MRVVVVNAQFPLLIRPGRPAARKPAACLQSPRLAVVRLFGRADGHAVEYSKYSAHEKRIPMPRSNCCELESDGNVVPVVPGGTVLAREREGLQVVFLDFMSRGDPEKTLKRSGGAVLLVCGEGNVWGGTRLPLGLFRVLFKVAS
jgi:hypothetical protein